MKKGPKTRVPMNKSWNFIGFNFQLHRWTPPRVWEKSNKYVKVPPIGSGISRPNWTRQHWWYQWMPCFCPVNYSYLVIVIPHLVIHIDSPIKSDDHCRCCFGFVKHDSKIIKGQLAKFLWTHSGKQIWWLPKPPKNTGRMTTCQGTIRKFCMLLNIWSAWKSTDRDRDRYGTATKPTSETMNIFGARCVNFRILIS